MLGHKIRHLRQQITPTQEASTRTKLHNSPFVHLIAEAHDSTTMHWVFRLFVWITLLFLPLAVLLTLQVRFLPYHSEFITWSHRIAVLLMVFVMGWMWPLIFCVQGDTRRRYNPLILLLSALGLLLHRLKCFWYWVRRKGLVGQPENLPPVFRGEGFSALWLSIFCAFLLTLVATVPDGWLDRGHARLWADFALTTEPCSPQSERQVFKPTAWLFGSDHHQGLSIKREKSSENKDCAQNTYTGWRPSRNIDVSDRRLIGWIDEPPSAKQNQATDAKPATLANNRLERLELRRRNLRYANLSDTWMPHVDLSGADLAYVWGEGVQMQYARLEKAKMQGAGLEWAKLQGANLSRAKLQVIHLGFAELQGADISWAEMQGTHLGSVGLQDADISWADLQGAFLQWAKLQDANLRGAKLQGADLREANMQDADFGSATRAWAELELADLREVRLNPLSTEKGDEAASTKQLRREQAVDAMFYSTSYFATWGKPPTETTYQKNLNAYLTDLACLDRYIAAGIARQAKLVYKNENEDQPIKPNLAQALLNRVQDSQCKPLAEGIRPYRKELERQEEQGK